MGHAPCTDRIYGVTDVTVVTNKRIKFAQEPFKRFIKISK